MSARSFRAKLPDVCNFTNNLEQTMTFRLPITIEYTELACFEFIPGNTEPPVVTVSVVSAFRFIYFFS